jgi:lipoprotein-anchoring transpeptidase ErfK/SrfK
MSKRAKRGKTETLALPVAGKVAVGAIAVAALGYSLLSHPASVQPVRKPSPRQVLLPPPPPPPPPPAPAPARALASVPAFAVAPQVEIQKAADVPGRLVRQVVDYVSHEAPGTVVIDTGNTFLYLVLNPRQAMRYGIGVGREAFTWSGEQAVSGPDNRMAGLASACRYAFASTLPPAIYGGRARQSARRSGHVSGRDRI